IAWKRHHPPTTCGRHCHATRSLDFLQPTVRHPSLAPAAPSACSTPRRYMSDLRDFLIKHPALVYYLGFERVLDPSARHGFDVAATVPKRRHFSSVLRE